MKKLRRRILAGTLVVFMSMAVSVFMTILYDSLVKLYGHEDRFCVIFGVGGAVIGCAVILFAMAIWTNNFGEGFKD